MPIHEYRYTDADGKEKTVERMFKIGTAPERIMVEEADEVYEAQRIMSRHANMATNWRVDTASDLPPTKHPFIK